MWLLCICVRLRRLTEEYGKAALQNGGSVSRSATAVLTQGSLVRCVTCCNILDIRWTLIEAIFHLDEQRTAPRRRQVGVVPEARVSRRGLAVICTRGWGQVSSARVLARSAISDERAYARRGLENRAEWSVWLMIIYSV